MRKLALSLLFLLAASFTATAQTNLTNGGGATPGCLSITQVDGQSESGAVCFGGFYGEDPNGIDIWYGQVSIEDCTITSQSSQLTGTNTYQVTSNFTCPASANTLQQTLTGTSVQQEQKVRRSCGRNACYALVVTGGTTTF